MNMKKIIGLLFVFLFSLVLTSCGPSNKDDDSTGKWEYKRDKSLTDFAVIHKLDTGAIGSDFDVTGRGYVKVHQFIDGDTVHFVDSNGDIIKARFLAIDTPESTGRVEPWGKPASTFTREKLSNAEAIVLESDVEGQPVFDSTGERYLTWVWYLPKGSMTWRNLNIEILQDGLAIAKKSGDNRYGSTAVDALSDAKKNHINLYGGKDPTFYYGDTVSISIKTLVTNKDTYDRMKVKFEGVVTKVEGQGCYIQQFDEDTNRSYGVYVYGGYDSLAPKFLVVGNRLELAGTPTNSEEFGFQVSGLSFSLIDPRKDDTKILESGVDVDYTVISGKELNENYYLEDLLIKMENVKVVDVYTTKDGKSEGAMTLTCKASDGETITVRTNILKDSNDTVITESYFRNKTITFIGLVDVYNGKPQAKLLSLSDLIERK